MRDRVSPQLRCAAASQGSEKGLHLVIATQFDKPSGGNVRLAFGKLFPKAIKLALPQIVSLLEEAEGLLNDFTGVAVQTGRDLVTHHFLKFRRKHYSQDRPPHSASSGPCWPETRQAATVGAGRFASIWPMASTTASKVSMVEAWRAL